MAAKRRTYWLTERVSQKCRERALLLNQKGFDVHFFTSFSALLSELDVQRAGVIVYGDEGSETILERQLLDLMSLPEIQGARLVLSVQNSLQRLRFLAACGGFRDILPMDLSESQWLQRFFYATAGRPIPFVQPSGQLTFNNISALKLPARLTWISNNRLRLESRVQPPVGSTLNMTGALAHAMGVNSITLNVVDTQRSHLLYRFSDAIVAEWNVPANATERAQRVIDDIRIRDTGPRTRIFLAVKSPELRSSIMTKLESPKFEISAALKKQSIVEEPKYFTPNLVFIEDRLCLDEDGLRFSQMLDNLDEQVPVIVVGHDTKTSALRRKYPGRRIVVVPRVPQNLGQAILNRYLPPASRKDADADRDALHVTSDNTYSIAEVTFPARLYRLHPLAGQIATPFYVGNFAIGRLESPVIRKAIGRSPFIKTTAIYRDTRQKVDPFVHLQEFYLADTDSGDRENIRQYLSRIFAHHMGVEPSPVIEAKSPNTAQRAPEMGSISRLPQRTTSVPAAKRPIVSSPPPSTPKRVASSDAEFSEPKNAPIHEETPPEKMFDTEPIIAPVAEAVEEIRKDVVRGVREGVQNENFRMIAKYLLVTGVMALFFYVMIGLIVPQWNKSGGQYTEQLFKFAPHLKYQQKKERERQNRQ